MTVRTLISSIALLGFMTASGALRAEEAGLNPAFIEYLQNKKASSLIGMAVGPGGYALGSIPEPLVFPKHVRSGVRGMAGTFPGRFDLRTSSPVGVTSVKDQYGCGSCWAFATMGSIESNILYTKNRYTDYSEEDLNLNNGFDAGACNGGTYLMSAAYLTRWSGPIPQRDQPNAYWFSEGDSVSPSQPAPPPISVNNYPTYHIQKVTRVANGPGFDDLDRLAIQLALYKNGGVGICFYVDTTPGAYYNPSHASYYYPDEKESNHCVLIVGWDDTYPAANFLHKPPADGAYIVKNSWGSKWGDKGYFYISYYDATLVSAYQFLQPEPNTKYGHVYQYDTLGLTTKHGFGGSDVGYFASAYLSTVLGKKLEAVGFWALSDDTDYEIRIYSDIAVGYGLADPTQGTLVATKKGHISDMGYNTIRLDKPVGVALNRPFSVVIRVKTNGNKHPIPLSKNISGYSSTANAAPGQSLISADGIAWLSTVSDTANKGNVNIKVFANR